MENIVVSVLTTTYNHAPYLRQALDSVLAQKTSFAFELLIHDDASTDGTSDIVRAYARRYPDRVRAIVQEENQYSQGVDVYGFFKPLIRGAYIALCEGDDYWCDERKLQLQVDFLEHHPECVACVHQTELLDMTTGERYAVSDRGCDGVMDFSEILAGNNHSFQVSSLLMRTEAILLPALPDFFAASAAVGDYPLSIFLALQGRIFYLNRTMSVYRYASLPTSWSYRMKNQREMRVRHCREMIEMLHRVDRYSGGQYHALIETRIDDFRYVGYSEQPIAQLVHDRTFFPYFRRQPARIRCKLLLRRLLPDRWAAFVRKQKRRRKKREK